MEIKWSQYPDILRYLLELEARNFTQPEIARQVVKYYPEIISEVPTRNQIKNALEYARAKAAYLVDRPVASIMPYYDRYRDVIEGVKTIEKDVSVLQSINEKERRKVFVISDIHVPFTDEQKLQKAVELNRSADIVIVAGDIMDMYSVSRHRLTKSVPIEVELDNTVRLLEYLSQEFPAVVVLPGNHDTRPLKKIQDLLPSSLLFLFQEDTLGLLTRPFSNVFYHNDWWYQLGDAIFAHAEISSSIEGRPPIRLSEWFLQKGWAKRLGLPEIRCVVLGHTHQVSTVYREDLKLFECGCLAQIMEYTMQPSAVMRPPMNGCVSLVQYNGKTDFNESREWIL